MTEASTQTLYARLGGAAAIRSVVDRFYELVLIDPALRPYFTGIDVGRLRRHQALFLSQVAGGPTEYDGRAMAEAHDGFGIDDAAFDRVATHLLEALQEHRVPQAEVDEVLSAVGGLRGAVVQDAT